MTNVNKGDRLHAENAVLLSVCVMMSVFGLVVATIRADEIPEARGVAPRGHTVFKQYPGGGIFVSKALKDEHDRLVDLVRGLKADIQGERITASGAAAELFDLQFQLANVRQKIERTQVIVYAAKSHTETETVTFDVGPARALVITADRLDVEGWDGPQVKCVLEKKVLSADDNPVDLEFQGIKLIHKIGQAPEVVGRTQSEIDADERMFLASASGQKLDDTQRAARRSVVREIADSYAIYRDLQGKEIDTIEISGLTHDQGNRHFSFQVTSPGGGGVAGSDWKRHAALTVYVPRCEVVAVRGCLAHLNVEGVRASLIVARDGSLTREYDASLQVRDLHGSLSSENVPLNFISTIRGNVKIVCTAELSGSGSRSKGDEHIIDNSRMRELICQNVDGDVTAWIARADLMLTDITGRIDIKNEFGDTMLGVTAPLCDKPHRILSEAGRIEVNLAPKSLGDLPVQALTNFGTIRTNLVSGGGQDVNFSSPDSRDGSWRDWHGINTKVFRDGENLFTERQRFNAVMTGADRTNGLDLVSRSGAVVVIRTK